MLSQADLVSGGLLWQKGSGVMFWSQPHPWTLHAHSLPSHHCALLGSHQNRSLLSGTFTSGQVTSNAGHRLAAGSMKGQEGQESFLTPAEAVEAVVA